VPRPPVFSGEGLCEPWENLGQISAGVKRIRDDGLRTDWLSEKCISDRLFTLGFGRLGLEPRRKTPLAAALVGLATFLALFVAVH
jgi:hypothetical protein